MTLDTISTVAPYISDHGGVGSTTARTDVYDVAAAMRAAGHDVTAQDVRHTTGSAWVARRDGRLIAAAFVGRSGTIYVRELAA